MSESIQPPAQWATGADPMTDKQAGFIKVLAKQAGESGEEAEQETQGLDKGSASEKIQELQGKAKGGGGSAGGSASSSGSGGGGAAKTQQGDGQAEVVGNVNDSKPAGGAGGAQPDSDEYLQHPEGWATGGEPATEKQKSFLAVLAKQSGDPDGAGDIDGLSKSEASEKIDAMKK